MLDHPQKPAEVEIDLSGVASEREVHEAFASSLHFPDFYGHNWDAFWDILCGFDLFPRRLTLVGREHLERVVPRAYERLQSCFSRTASKSIRTLHRASPGDDTGLPQPSKQSQATDGRGQHVGFESNSVLGRARR